MVNIISWRKVFISITFILIIVNFHETHSVVLPLVNNVGINKLVLSLFIFDQLKGHTCEIFNGTRIPIKSSILKRQLTKLCHLTKCLVCDSGQVILDGLIWAGLDWSAIATLCTGFTSDETNIDCSQHHIPPSEKPGT